MAAEEGKLGVLGPAAQTFPLSRGGVGWGGGCPWGSGRGEGGRPEAGEAGGTGVLGQTLWAGRPAQAPRLSRRPENREMPRVLLGEAENGDVSFPDSQRLVRLIDSQRVLLTL